MRPCRSIIIGDRAGWSVGSIKGVIGRSIAL